MEKQRQRRAGTALLASLLSLALPVTGFCANVQGAGVMGGPVSGGPAASSPVQVSLPTTLTLSPLLLPGTLPLPSLPASAASAPTQRAGGRIGAAQSSAANAAVPLARASAVNPGAPHVGPLSSPEAAAALTGGSAVSPSSRANGASRPGVDPRDAGFEQKTWDDAVARGFARAGSVNDSASGASGPGAPTLPPSVPGNGATEPPAPPPPPSKSDKVSVFSGKVLGFFSTFLLIQLAVESLALAIPQMTDPLKNGFIALAGLASTSYLAYSIGSFLGGRLVQRLGLGRVYRATLATRTVIWTAVAFLFHANHGAIPLAPLIGLFSLDYFVHSMGRVAERTLQGEWFKDSPAASNKFGTMRDFVEYGTVFTTMGTGLVIATMGFGAIIYAAPIMFGLAALLALALRGLPQKSTVRARKVALFAGFKRLFRPEMRPIFLSRLLINNFVYLLYYVTATAFGMVFAHGHAGIAAAAASALIGLLGMGANGAAVANAFISRRVEKATESLPEADRSAAQSKLMAASAGKAMRWAALAMLGGWLFVSQVAIGTVAGPVIAAAPFLGVAGLLGLAFVALKAAKNRSLLTKATALKSAKWLGLALIGGAIFAAKAHLAPALVWPLFAISPALILIGYTGQLALTQLDTLLLDRMPKRTKAYVVGADRTLTNLSYVFNFLFWGVIFQFFGSAGFIGLGIYSTLTAVAYLWLSKRVAKS